MDAKNQLQVYPNSAALSEAAAGLISRIAARAVNDRGRFVISLSGGNTPEQLFTLLSKTPFSTQIPWSKTFIFWGDERCVPTNDKRNNSNRARSLLLDKIEIPVENIYPVPVELEPVDAAAQYEKAIKGFFGNEAPNFDLMLLGLGENGHTASLFPGTPVLNETKALVKEVYVEEQKMFRVTMTAPLINLSHNIVFLVSGTGKAEIIKTVLTGPYLPTLYPAQMIKPVAGQLLWLLDKEAGSLLPHEHRIGI